MPLATIYLHPKCYSSFKLYKYLIEEGLLDKVKLIDTSKHSFEPLAKGIISVPAVEKDGKIFFQGAVDHALFKKLLSGKPPHQENLDYKAGLIDGIINSFLASAWVYLTQDLAAVYDLKEFTLAVTGMIFSQDPLGEYERRRAELTALDVASFEKGLIRNIAGNFLRELYWLHGGIPAKDMVERKYTGEVFLHWLASRASIGRVSVAHTLLDADAAERSEKAREYIFSRYERIAPKIVKEQEELEGFKIESPERN